MPRFSFILSIDAPDADTAHAVRLAAQAGAANYRPPGTSRQFGPLLERDIQSDIDRVHDALCDLGFDDPHARTSASDTLDVMCQLFPTIAAIATPAAADDETDDLAEPGDLPSASR